MSQSSTCRTVVAVAVASLACTSPAAAQAPVAPPPLPPTTVTVTGTGTVTPSPLNRKNNASIAKAVSAAEQAAAPLAIANGRASPANVAARKERELGTLLANTEGASGPTPFFFVGPYGGQEGTFGPGKFCGTIRRVVFKTDSAGKRKRVGTRSMHTCRVPPQVAISYGMTFSMTPAA